TATPCINWCTTPGASSRPAWKPAATPWPTFSICLAGRGKIRRPRATKTERENDMSQEPLMARWRRWLRQIEQTQEHELSCSDCFEQLSDYVDLELAGEPVAERLPMLRQHLAQCGVCHDEYQV